MIQKIVDILGVPYRAGQPLGGVEKGPMALRSAGLAEWLQLRGRDTIDSGSLAQNHGLPDEIYTQIILNRLSEKVHHTLRKGRFPLILGGDHTVAAGSVRGAIEAHPDLALVWLDAHGDSNTPQTSPTGNWHGMPLAALMGWLGHAPRSSHPLAPPAGFEPLNPRRVAILGARSLDPLERSALETAGVFVRSAQDIRQQGVARIWRDCAHAIDPRGVRPLYLSFDIDSLDPDYAPATGIHESGGLIPEEASQLAAALSATGRLVGMDVVELNPDQAKPADLELTLASVFEVISGALVGGKLRGHLRRRRPLLPSLVKSRDRTPGSQRDELIDVMDRSNRDSRYGLYPESG
jgi:arginase